MSLIKGTPAEQGARLLERTKELRQSAQDLRVDAIAEGDQETEWVCDQLIAQHDDVIAHLERRLKALGGLRLKGENE